METYKARQGRLNALYLACVAGTYISGGYPMPREMLHMMPRRGPSGSRPKSQQKRRIIARQARLHSKRRGCSLRKVMGC